MMTPKIAHPDYLRHPQHRFMGGPLVRLLEVLRDEALSAGDLEAWRVLTSGAFVLVRYDKDRSTHCIEIGRNGWGKSENWQQKWEREIDTFASKFRIDGWTREYLYDEQRQAYKCVLRPA